MAQIPLQLASEQREEPPCSFNLTRVSSPISIDLLVLGKTGEGFQAPSIQQILVTHPYAESEGLFAWISDGIDGCAAVGMRLNVEDCLRDFFANQIDSRSILHLLIAIPVAYNIPATAFGDMRTASRGLLNMSHVPGVNIELVTGWRFGTATAKLKLTHQALRFQSEWFSVGNQHLLAVGRPRDVMPLVEKFFERYAVQLYDMVHMMIGYHSQTSTRRLWPELPCADSDSNSNQDLNTTEQSDQQMPLDEALVDSNCAMTLAVQNAASHMPDDLLLA